MKRILICGFIMENNIGRPSKSENPQRTLERGAYIFCWVIGKFITPLYILQN